MPKDLFAKPYGDEVAGATALIDSAVATGGHGVPVPLNAAMQNDLPAIASRVNRRTRAVYLVNPHNPTGTVNDAEELARFVRDVSDRTLVIVDEAYLEFADFYARRTLATAVRGARLRSIGKSGSAYCGH